jgi:hypothetical protein
MGHFPELAMSRSDRDQSSSASPLPEAIMIHDGTELGAVQQQGVPVNPVKPELVDDPLLTPAEVMKMKAQCVFIAMMYPVCLYVYLQSWVERSREKFE